MRTFLFCKPIPNLAAVRLAVWLAVRIELIRLIQFFTIKYKTFNGESVTLLRAGGINLKQASLKLQHSMYRISLTISLSLSRARAKLSPCLVLRQPRSDIASPSNVAQSCVMRNSRFPRLQNLQRLLKHLLLCPLSDLCIDPGFNILVRPIALKLAVRAGGS